MRRTLVGLGSLTAVAGKVYFSETFDDSWESRWVKSEWKKSEGTAGDFGLATGKYFADEKEDKGLMTTQDARFYDISASFDSFSNAGKDLIIQYQVKYEKDIDCGGGYIKIGPKMDDPEMFGEPTPYNIMFGPDRCGYTSRTHLIFHHKGVNVLKKTDMMYKQQPPFTSHLYRMTLYPNNTVKVDIDNEEAYFGIISEDWDMGLAKEIPDPESIKPDDWEEESFIDDPEEPKPEGWVDREFQRIRDPKATRPPDWDESEDGVWEAPMITNEGFRGDWSATRIKNPVFKGYWEQKKIANPDFHDDPDIYLFKDFGFIGIDLWQMKAGTLFDNIIITDDPAEADAFVPKWEALAKVEHEELEKKAERDRIAAEEEEARRNYNPDDEEEDYDELDKRSEDL
mmetsp:Transcript_114398/g.202778  ORF Transcript_114398/g.202778 Transcript_114398/m.202778 type:complete len:398 (-) Transcript_114398:38-1231(-)